MSSEATAGVWLRTDAMFSEIGIEDIKKMPEVFYGVFHTPNEAHGPFGVEFHNDAWCLVNANGVKMPAASFARVKWYVMASVAPALAARNLSLEAENARQSEQIAGLREALLECLPLLDEESEMRAFTGDETCEYAQIPVIAATKARAALGTEVAK